MISLQETIQRHFQANVTKNFQENVDSAEAFEGHAICAVSHPVEEVDSIKLT
jgi:hypothetical protein